MLGALEICARSRRGDGRRDVESRNRRWLGCADIAIAPNTGPEAVAGSTRLKAGTSQKMVLNLLSTAAMVRLGRVYENWMMHVALTNREVRAPRRCGFCSEAAGASASTAAHALRQSGTRSAGGARDAEDRRKCVRREARASQAGGNVRLAIESLDRKRSIRKTGKGDKHMDRFKIHGGRKLEGTVQISGAKNAALPAMAAALLTAEPVCLQNIPRVRDIITMAKLLAHMRCRVESPDMPPSEFMIQAENVSMPKRRTNS